MRWSLVYYESSHETVLDANLSRKTWQRRETNGRAAAFETRWCLPDR